MPKIVELITSRSERISPATCLRDVAAQMLAAKVSSVIVVDDGKAVGIITERDILRIMQQHGSPALSAGETMSQPVHCVAADTDYRQAYREAARCSIRRIVVIDDDPGALCRIASADAQRHRKGPLHRDGVRAELPAPIAGRRADDAQDLAALQVEREFAGRGRSLCLVEGRTVEPGQDFAG